MLSLCRNVNDFFEEVLIMWVFVSIVSCIMNMLIFLVVLLMSIVLFVF